MKVGRPSEYKPEYCQEVIDFMSEGYSIGAFAGHIGVARQTLYNWMDAHPEFMDAVKVAEGLSQNAWESRLIDFSKTGEGNATALIFGLKNRARHDWRDVTTREVSGVDGGAIEIKTKRPEDLTDEELAALAQSGK